MLQNDEAIQFVCNENVVVEGVEEFTRLARSSSHFKAVFQLN